MLLRSVKYQIVKDYQLIIIQLFASFLHNVFTIIDILQGSMTKTWQSRGLVSLRRAPRFRSFSPQTARPQSYRFLSVHLLYNHSHSRRQDPSHTGFSVFIYFTIHSHSRWRDPSHTGSSVVMYFTIILTADGKTPVIQVPQCSFTLQSILTADGETPVIQVPQLSFTLYQAFSL